ncbi:DUF692 family multinuclear iron-containing protein [Streptomyces sp. NPDC053728]|uniref:multinuclear nonheme iron-dependent oxidase n=1 Tax=Streptomyces sp. NPDC053728 TaxID=3155534 RepID=UPI0034458DA6
MLIGVNVTSPETLELACSLEDSGHIDFVEVLVDGFAHIDPAAFREVIGDLPVGCHIMLSRFLDPEPERLDFYAGLVERWQRACGFLYVSDHIAHFVHRGRPLPTSHEADYGDWEPVIARAREWRERLGCPLALENFPSKAPGTRPQAEAYAELVERSGCEVLLDLSNAVVAELNTGEPADAWPALPGVGGRYHLAGYRESPVDPSLIIDSHDVELSARTLDLLTRAASTARPDATLVVERDANHVPDEWRADIERARAAVSAAGRLPQPRGA